MGRILVSHENRRYKHKMNRAKKNRYNGAFYYSQEITRNIIPRVKTDRKWITVNIPGVGCNHSIVFVHNNIHPENYDWLTQYEDVILVCGIQETCKRVAHIGTPVYLPLSIDTLEVARHRKPKTKGAAFAGRQSKRNDSVPAGIDCLEGMPRPKLLDCMAEYKQIYAVGRTAIEAKALGCEVLPYDDRFQDPDRWKVLDNTEAAIILQRELDKIDHPERVELEELEPEELEPEKEKREENGTLLDKPKENATKGELLTYAGLTGITVTSRMTKTEIVQKLRDAGLW